MQFPSNSLSQVLQSQPMQKPGSIFNRFWKKGNNRQAAAQKNSHFIEKLIKLQILFKETMICSR